MTGFFFFYFFLSFVKEIFSLACASHSLAYRWAWLFLSFAPLSFFYVSEHFLLLFGSQNFSTPIIEH